MLRTKTSSKNFLDISRKNSCTFFKFCKFFVVFCKCWETLTKFYPDFSKWNSNWRKCRWNITNFCRDMFLCIFLKNKCLKTLFTFVCNGRTILSVRYKDPKIWIFWTLWILKIISYWFLRFHRSRHIYIFWEIIF